MTYATFTPPFAPLDPCEHQENTRFIAAQFGDGYTQRTPDGAEYVQSGVVVTFEPLTIAQALSMDNFFRANAGLPINYTVPVDDVAGGVWYATDWTLTRNETSYSMRVTLAAGT